MIETINYKGKDYPALQAEGFAAQWIFPFASKYLSGRIIDIGCNRLEWCFPGAFPIDPALNKHDAMNIPYEELDGVFSSHCLEHLPDWVAALDYWATRIKKCGVLFLYLPNMEHQQYWAPWNNRKHLHFICPTIIDAYFHDRQEMWTNVFVTPGCDLNGSFTVIAEKI